MSNPTTSSNTPAPWWKFGHVWLVVSGPLIVVVASFLTFYIAVRGMDPIVDENYYQAGLDINKSLAAKPESLAPAMQARNHAATGVVPNTAPR
ncbi:FixH family protein [Rhodoferax mekongensis]|uniref:FixH family protein n=1 Tax=Rhodoferax mekongensis TaxID=3068341 RepID=A0ABZ0AUN2_9BURK|nr:FixH family protein [Rhodoferax sp. TBRC 17307]WNO03352.1 FixH family protein [Rhodoferax sp. TBRC 17307]